MKKARGAKNGVVSIEERRRRIAALYCEGHSQYAIARSLKVSQPTVCLDLKAIQARWLESSLLDFDHRKAQELAKLNHLEAEAWEAWHNGRRQPGDARYLAIVAKCIETRLKVMGALAPDQLAQVQQVAQVDWGSLYRTAEQVSQRVNPITQALQHLDSLKPVGPIRVLDTTPAHHSELNKPKDKPAPKPKPKRPPVGDDF